MSGHETIRVLEVGVDAQVPAEEEDKGLEGVAAGGCQSGGPAEASEPAGEAGPDNPDSSAEATGTRPLLPSGIAPPWSLSVIPRGASTGPWGLGGFRVLSSSCPLDSLWPWPVLLVSFQGCTPCPWSFGSGFSHFQT